MKYRFWIKRFAVGKYSYRVDKRHWGLFWKPVIDSNDINIALRCFYHCCEVTK